MHNTPENTEQTNQINPHLIRPHESVETELLKDLLSDSSEDIIKACHGIVRLAKQDGDLSGLRPNATGDLLKLVITTLNKEVRYCAISAFLALHPSLEKTAIRFAEKIEAATAKKIYETGKSLYAGHYDWTNFPIAEQILLAGNTLCESLMRAHFVNQGSSDNEYIKFAVIALEEGLNGLKVKETMDDLSAYRPLLPLEIRALQNDLDSLAKEGILKKEIKVISLSKTARTRNKEITNPDHTLRQSKIIPPTELDTRVAAELSSQKNKSDHLCRKLAVAKSFSQASSIIIALGDHGDIRAIQALKQAQMGLVDGGGMFLRFDNDQRNDELLKLCQVAIDRIIKRVSSDK